MNQNEQNESNQNPTMVEITEITIKSDYENITIILDDRIDSIDSIDEVEYNEDLEEDDIIKIIWPDVQDYVYDNILNNNISFYIEGIEWQEKEEEDQNEE